MDARIQLSTVFSASQSISGETGALVSVSKTSSTHCVGKAVSHCVKNYN